MRVPGSNILKLALSVIGSQNVNWYQFASQEDGSTGLNIVTYNAAQLQTVGSVQPMPRDRYSLLGLDWQKSYITWYVPNVNAQSISRNPDNSGDVIEWPVAMDGTLVAGTSRRYQLIGDTPWTNVDGWTGVIGCDIGPATGDTTNA